MHRIIRIIFFLLAPIFLTAEVSKENERKISIKFKILSFFHNPIEITFKEGKDFKPIDILEDKFGIEYSYIGESTIEFYQKINKFSVKTDSAIVQSSNENNNPQDKLGDEYNKILNEINIFGKSLTNPDSPTINEINRFNELQQQLDLIKEKLDSERLNNDNLRKKVYEDSEVEIKPVKQSSSSPNYTQNQQKPEFVPLAKFTIPASGGNYILIFNKTPNGVTISPLNDAPGIFPFGSYQFINLSGTTVELRFGSKVIPLSPNGRTVFKPETANGEYLEGEFWTKVDDEFKLGYKFRNLHISRIRTLAFIMPTAPGQSALNLKIAEERGQIEPPAPPENPKDKGKKNKEAEKKEPENRPFG